MLDHHAMRPRFVLTVLLIVEIFCLVMVFSPGLWRSKRQLSAAGAMLRNRTTETELAYQQAHDRDRFRQYRVCTLAVVNAIVIIVYGALQQRKRVV